MVTSYLSKKSSQGHSDSESIDLSSSSFRHFNKKEYGQLKNINDFSQYNDLESILQIEYLRNRQIKEGLQITYGNWRNMFNNIEYFDFYSEFLEINFNREIYNKYFAEYAAGFMTWGWDYGKMLKYLNLDENNRYVNRIQEYRQLLNNGLTDEAYGLSQKAKSLDKNIFTDLLKSYEKSPLLIVFWSAQAAGASIIDELPSLKAFEINFKDKINVVYICVDKEENKNMWAARIIDESWKGNHYFLPIDGNDSTLKQYSDKNISSLCSGGASYSFIDENGKIKKDIEGPFYLRKNETEAVYK